jgi:hypothetical protein
MRLVSSVCPPLHMAAACSGHMRGTKESRHDAETAWNRERTTGLEPATYGLGSRAEHNYARTQTATHAAQTRMVSGIALT